MKKLKFLTLAALLVLPLAACDEDEGISGADANGTITGTVTIDGSGASGVTVTLGGAGSQTATTDAQGRYTFSNVSAGSYTVTISGFPADVAFGSTTQTAVITTSGQVVTVDFSGSAIRTSAILGSVTSGGVGVQGVTVSITGPENRNTTTDANGQFAAGGLRAGTYTVAITGVPAGVNCAATSQSVTLGTGETKVASFSCTPAANATISGRLFLDENDKNDLFDGPALEENLMAANVAITLEGPTVGVTQTTQTDANGMYSFTDLEAGTYNVTIASTDPDIPSGVTYGGSSTTFGVTLPLGGSASVNFPFDITTQTVLTYAFLGRDPQATGVSTSIPRAVAPTAGVILDLFPTEADAIAGTNRLDRDTTDLNGEVQFMFNRTADTSPSGATRDNIVFAQFVSAPPNHTLNGESRIEIAYDPRLRTDMAGDTFDVLNTGVVMVLDALTVETRDPLAGWNAALWRNDTTQATIQSGVTNSAGRVTFTENTGLAALPDTFYLRLSGAQPNANGHAFEQDPEAQELATERGRYLRLIHSGTIPTVDTVDVGNEIVTFLDSDVLIRVHHEQDDSTDVPTFTAGDNFENVDNIQVTLRWREAGATADSTRVGTAMPADGTLTFPNVPTLEGPYTLEASATTAFQVVLNDTLVTIGEVSGGDLDGQGQAILVCPLGNNTPAACGTFAYKYNNTSITGKVKASDSTAATGLVVTLTPHPMNIQPGYTSKLDTTDANGLFSFAGLREGPHIVSVAGNANWAFFPPNNAADTLDMQGNADNDIISFIATFMNTSVSGVVANDRDQDQNTIDPGEALEGVTINLYRDGSGAATISADSLIGTTTSGVNGGYTFTGLREGRYIVQAEFTGSAKVLRDYIFSGTAATAKDTAVVTTAATTAGAGGNNTRNVGSQTPVPLPRWDYGESKGNFVNPANFTFLYNTGTATGKVTRTSDGSAVAGMTVTLRRCNDSTGAASPPQQGTCTTYFPGAPQNTSTDATGTFVFTSLEEGVYEVTPSPTTAGFTTALPSSRLFLIVGANDVETGNFTVQ